MKRNFAARMRAAALGASLAAYALVAFATLKPGDHAPAFVAQASLGGNTYDYSLADALKKGPVVLYFYPAAFTKGCTIEAHEFAEAVDQYKAEGATVIGVSHDDIDTLKRFSVSECRSKFPVAADADSKIIKSYDAALPIVLEGQSRVVRDRARRHGDLRIHEPLAGQARRQHAAGAARVEREAQDADAVISFRFKVGFKSG